jgi:hypothetical protein
MKDLPLSSEIRHAAREVLEISDLAKFARFEPSLEERRQDVEKIRDFVRRTRPGGPVG